MFRYTCVSEVVGRVFVSRVVSVLEVACLNVRVYACLRLRLFLCCCVVVSGVHLHVSSCSFFRLFVYLCALVRCVHVFVFSFIGVFVDSCVLPVFLCD